MARVGKRYYIITAEEQADALLEYFKRDRLYVPSDLVIGFKLIAKIAGWSDSINNYCCYVEEKYKMVGNLKIIKEFTQHEINKMEVEMNAGYRPIDYNSGVIRLLNLKDIKIEVL